MHMTYQQNIVYFVIIACKSIMGSLLIMTRAASQYFFVRKIKCLFCMDPEYNSCFLQLFLFAEYSYNALLLRIPAIIWSC